jgi:hypothetical protein
VFSKRTAVAVSFIVWLGGRYFISLSFIGADYLVDAQCKQLVKAKERSDEKAKLSNVGNDRTIGPKRSRLRIQSVESLLMGLEEGFLSHRAERNCVGVDCKPDPQTEQDAQKQQGKKSSFRSGSHII